MGATGGLTIIFRLAPPSCVRPRKVCESVRVNAGMVIVMAGDYSEGDGGRVVVNIVTLN